MVAHGTPNGKEEGGLDHGLQIGFIIDEGFQMRINKKIKISNSSGIVSKSWSDAALVSKLNK